MNIKNLDLITKIAPSFSFQQIKYIIEMKCFTEFNNFKLFNYENRMNLDIISLIESKGNNAWYEVKIRFSGIENFEFFTNGGIIQLCGLDVEDYRDRSWENIRFLVTEFENRDVSFYCNAIEILEVKKSWLKDDEQQN